MSNSAFAQFIKRWMRRRLHGLRGRRGEMRPAERLGMIASPVVDLLLHGQYRKYRSIRASTLARAIIGLTREKAAGRFVFEHDAILRAARKAGD